MARKKNQLKSNATRVSLNDRFTGIKKPNMNAILKQQKLAAEALMQSQKIILQMEKRPAVRAAFQKIKSESHVQPAQAKKQKAKQVPNVQQKQKFSVKNNNKSAPVLSVKDRIQLPVKRRLQLRVKDRLSINMKATTKQKQNKIPQGGFRNAFTGSTGAPWSNLKVKPVRGGSNPFAARKQKGNLGAHLKNTHLQTGAKRNQGIKKAKAKAQQKNKGSKGFNKK